MYLRFKESTAKELQENAEGSFVPLPNGFTPLAKLARDEYINASLYQSSAKTPREYMVTCFGGVVRSVSADYYVRYPKLSVFLNCQDSMNNSTGVLDFPISLMKKDFPNFMEIEIEEGDTFIGLNFGILKEDRTLNLRYDAVSKFISQVLIFPHKYHSAQLSLDKMSKLVKSYSGIRANMIPSQRYKECLKLLKALRGLQTMYSESEGLNQNERILIKDVDNDSRFLTKYGAQGQGIHNIIVKASLLVEVLWVYNYRSFKYSQSGSSENSGKNGLTAVLEVTDYTQNPLLGETQFGTPYASAFKNTALFVCLWDEVGRPFNALELVEGDILYLSNVSFKFGKAEVTDSEKSTRKIEGHIRGGTGSAESSISVVTKFGRSEKEFMIRREAYLKQHMHTCPDRQLKRFRGDQNRNFTGVPTITIGERDGQDILKLTSDLFYDSYRNVGGLKLASSQGSSQEHSEESIKRSISSLEVKHEQQKEQPKKKVRKFPPVAISPLVVTKQDGSHPDGLDSCYQNGKGVPRYEGKHFVIIGNITKLKPANVADWIINDSGKPKFQFTLILEGQDSVEMPIKFDGMPAEYFLGATAAAVQDDPSFISKRIEPLISSIANTIWVKLIVKQVTNSTTERCEWFCTHTYIVRN